MYQKSYYNYLTVLLENNEISNRRHGYPVQSLLKIFNLLLLLFTIKVETTKSPYYSKHSVVDTYLTGNSIYNRNFTNKVLYTWTLTDNCHTFYLYTLRTDEIYLKTILSVIMKLKTSAEIVISYSDSLYRIVRFSGKITDESFTHLHYILQGRWTEFVLTCNVTDDSWKIVLIKLSKSIEPIKILEINSIYNDFIATQLPDLKTFSASFITRLTETDYSIIEILNGKLV
jgi:hypothetical protein